MNTLDRTQDQITLSNSGGERGIRTPGGVHPRAAILAMPEYHPPLAGRDALRLDFNENTFAASPRVLARILATTAEGLTKYPERAPVERIVAAHFGLAPGQILLTNGVDEAIHLICATFLDPGDEALIATPGFFMYDVSIQLMVPGGLRKVQADSSLAFPYERMLAAITPRTRLIIVASPNNPTGSIIPREHLLALCAAAPQALVMVDEAYFHFHGETTLPDVGRVPNLLVARTFSKAYGLANLRVGMIAAREEIIGYLRKASSPYNVNGIALDCLPEALADEDYLSWYVDQVTRGRDRMMAGLDALGVPYFESHANFVLMKIGPKHKELVAAMRTRGVLLRDRSADPGCEGFVRITIGVEDHVTAGLGALKDALAEITWQPALPLPLSDRPPSSFRSESAESALLSRTSHEDRDLLPFRSAAEEAALPARTRQEDRHLLPFKSLTEEPTSPPHTPREDRDLVSFESRADESVSPLSPPQEDREYE